MNIAAEQLDKLRAAMLAAGWQMVSAGRWRLNTWGLETAYVWGEVTVRLTCKGESVAEYRGTKAVLWVREQAKKHGAKNFANQLDKVLAAE